MLFSLIVSCAYISDEDFNKRVSFLMPSECMFMEEYVNDDGSITVPEGALDYGVRREELSLDAVDLPYDGIDANCDGQNDFDRDGDGFVSQAFAGI